MPIYNDNNTFDIWIFWYSVEIFCCFSYRYHIFIEKHIMVYSNSIYFFFVALISEDDKIKTLRISLFFYQKFHPKNIFSELEAFMCGWHTILVLTFWLGIEFLFLYVYNIIYSKSKIVSYNFLKINL